MLAQLSLLIRTLPYLRWEQLVYRPIRWGQYRAYRAFPFLTKHWAAIDKPVNEISPSTLSIFRQVFDTQFAHWSTPLREIEARLSDLKAARFTFLNETRELSSPDWNVRYVNHLWNYQLHYHDYVVWLVRDWLERKDDISRQRARFLIETWIAHARIGVSDGWSAYPLSLRVVHWIYAYSLAAAHESDREFLARWRTSIFRQLEFLSSHLETHLLANHLFKNVKALVIGGLFFAHEPRGRQWLETGEQLLERELAEQVLPDGGHYERSPMYHAQTLGDTLECYALLKAFGRPIATEKMQHGLLRMTDFLEALSYSDGSLALFNDSANTFETRPAPLLESVSRVCGERKNVLPMNFPDTGYYVWQSANRGEKIIVDAGEPAASYNMAHAHCDMLSYELWLNGEPFIVDSGVHGYGGDQFREYCRSTRAHNTVTVDHQEQSEIWGTFRVARRAQLLQRSAETSNKVWRFAGTYVSYLKSGFCHTREIERTADGRWLVSDDIVRKNVNDKPYQVLHSFIHLHASVKVKEVTKNKIFCRMSNRTVLIEIFGATDIQLVEGAMTPQIQGWQFPEFGKALPGVTIILQREIGKLMVAVPIVEHLAAKQKWGKKINKWQDELIHSSNATNLFGYRISPC